MSALVRLGRKGAWRNRLFLGPRQTSSGLELTAGQDPGQTPITVDIFGLGWREKPVPLPGKPTVTNDQQIVFHDARHGTDSRRVRIDGISALFFVANVRLGEGAPAERLVVVPFATWFGTLLAVAIGLGGTFIALSGKTVDPPPKLRGSASAIEPSASAIPTQSATASATAIASASPSASATASVSASATVSAVEPTKSAATSSPSSKPVPTNSTKPATLAKCCISAETGAPGACSQFTECKSYAPPRRTDKCSEVLKCE